jgi:hypothetical protein
MATDLNVIGSYARDFGLSRRAQSPELKIPADAVPVLAIGAQPSPAYGAGSQVTLCQYTVQPQWIVWIFGVLFHFDGSGFVPGSGDIVWSIDINRPAGAPVSIGYTEKNFGAIKWPLGSYEQPWPVRLRHRESETLRVKAYTVANVGIGAPNYITGALHGYTWPAKETEL